MTTPTKNPDVVVGGAGPVGLAPACALPRRGVSIRIVDKLSAPTDESRAIAIHARSCDMLDRMGVLDDLIATGVKSTAMNMFANGKKMFRAPLDTVDSPFAYTLITAQTETERVLTEHLTALGVSVERGLTLTELRQDADAVHLTLQHADGTTEQANTSWLIGTD